MRVEVFPSSIIGEMSVPSSKSHTIRGLVIATLASGKSTIRNPLCSEDILSAARNVEQLGAKITREEKYWLVEGTGGRLKTAEDVVDVGNSGTTLYFLTSVASLLSDYTIFTGDSSIRNRPIQPLLDALKSLGAQGSTANIKKDSPPFFVKGPLVGGSAEVPCQTSQYISSLMIAAPLCEEDTLITTKNPMETPYLQMTIDWLKKNGIEIEYDSTGYENFKIKGRQEYKAFDETIPSDWSSVAFPTAAALTKGSELTIHNMDFYDSQGDAAVIDYFIKMGADITKDLSEGKLYIKGGKKLEGITIDLVNTPDALPICCVAGVMANGTTILDNVAGARVKETDRVQVMTEALAEMGADIKATENTITINGGKPIQGKVLDSHGDHRIAMALTVAGLFAEGSTTILGAECASITFPDFYKKFKSCGVKLIEV